MTAYGEMLLSRIIDANDPGVLRRFGVDHDMFATEPERQAAKFIADYAEQNNGRSPDMATVVSEVPEFYYLPEITESYDYLAAKIKESYGVNEYRKQLTSEKLARIVEKNDPEEIGKYLRELDERITMRTSVRELPGTNVKTIAEQFEQEYERRKAGDSFKIWRSKFPSINAEIGGYFSGNLYTWYGRSGRGKSVFTLVEAIESSMQGATVLLWTLEMPLYEVVSRIISLLSAHEGVNKTELNGVMRDVGYENKQMLMGALSEEQEKSLMQFLSRLHQLLPGNIIIRAVDDQDFPRRNVKQLEDDIKAVSADVVVLDPFYYIDYERNTSKTTGGDAANTSKKLRHIAGYTKTTIHVITQSDEVKDETDDEGNRPLRAAKRSEIKKTKAVLEDAVNTFGIDTVDSLGVIELGKGRNGGEGAEVEVTYFPNFGIVQEVDAADEARKFTEAF